MHINWYPLDSFNPSNVKPFELYDIKDIVRRCLKVVFCAGSGELVMGAMWFLYTLIYSFFGMCLLWFAIGQIHARLSGKRQLSEDFPFKLMTIMLLLFAIVSCLLTQRFEFTISRLSTALTAMWLIWLGFIINQKLKCSYDSKWTLVICSLIFLQCIMIQHRGVTMAMNQFQDILQITFGTCSLVYVWCYIARKIQGYQIGKFIAYIGKNSLYIMAFHIVGFFTCNSILLETGFYESTDSRSLYTFDIGDNYLLWLVYIIFAICVPLLIVNIYIYFKRFIPTNT